MQKNCKLPLQLAGASISYTVVHGKRPAAATESVILATARGFGDYHLEILTFKIIVITILFFVKTEGPIFRGLFKFVDLAAKKDSQIGRLLPSIKMATETIKALRNCFLR